MKAKNSITGLWAVFIALSCSPVHAQDAAGDWVGQLNGGFKVRIHITKANATYAGYLTNASGDQTTLDEVISEGSHLPFAVRI